jgi:hypothetical protein
LPTLRWWNLVERIPSADPDAKHSGLWRPTPLGHEFAMCNVAVPKTAYTYKGEVEYMSDDTVLIVNCFGKKFSYIEVMSG